MAGPTVAVLAYLAITFAYSSEKKMIIQQVKQHLTFTDIAKDPAGLFTPTQYAKRASHEDLCHARGTAATVTAKCLSRWDGLLGMRAQVDSSGKRSGIWMDKFETVRFGCMLLAFRRVNAKRLLQGELT